MVRDGTELRRLRAGYALTGIESSMSTAARKRKLNQLFKEGHIKLSPIKEQVPSSSNLCMLSALLLAILGACR